MKAREQTKSARIRSSLGHPVVDADGHFQELLPAFKEYFLDYVKEVGGGQVAQRFLASGALGTSLEEHVRGRAGTLTMEQRRAGWVPRSPWWSLPTKNTRDVASTYLPGLLHERLEEMGIDFSVMYPSLTMRFPDMLDAELRQVATRAANRFHMENFKPYADRLAPAAGIPAFTPAEAIGELEYCVKELGYKAIFISPVQRPVNGGTRLDTFGIDSEYDYDPLWQRCQDLRVCPTFHASGIGWGSRRSISSYVYNHIGSFGSAGEAVCKSLFLGGVTRRFPSLRFGFLEGGVSWACSLYADLVGHWEKRNVEALMENLDPAKLDRAELMRLIEQYGNKGARAALPEIEQYFKVGRGTVQDMDEWAALGAKSEEQLRELFTSKFYFGCEADDPMIPWAFNQKVNPVGATLHAMFSSDMGHWDVADMSKVVEEAHELVEDGRLTAPEFREFAFTNPVEFYVAVNPDFFEGTAVAGEARKVAQKIRRGTKG